MGILYSLFLFGKVLNGFENFRCFTIYYYCAISFTAHRMISSCFMIGEEQVTPLCFLFLRGLQVFNSKYQSTCNFLPS